MAAKCEFPADQLTERVRDQLIVWCYSGRIRERLLQEPATKTLDEFVSLAVTMKRAMVEAPALAPVERKPVNRVKTTATYRDQQQHKGRSKSKSCFNCGQTNHIAKSDICPARDKKCGSCNKTGHFARVSRQGSRRHRSKSHHRRPAHTNKVSESADQFDDSDGELTEVRSIYVNSVTAAQVGNFKRVNCFVDNVPLEFIVDTGASVHH